MRYIIVIAAMFILLSACMHEPIHQGNRLDLKKINMVAKDLTKFNVEQLLGTPILKDVLHPNRVTYIEEFEDEASGKLLIRGVEIIYNRSLRVKEIRRFGFDEKVTTQSEGLSDKL